MDLIPLSLNYQNLRKRAVDLADFFWEKHRFEFIRSLHSKGGGALLCVERDDPGSGTARRHIVVKHGLFRTIDEDLRAEGKILETLRGAEHICQILSFVDDVPDDSSMKDEYAEVWNAPYIVLEAVAGGTLLSFINKNQSSRLSEDMLWILYLCLIRACVAMAYPPYGDVGAPVRKERIPPNTPPSGLNHGDVHTENILFGDGLVDDEHFGAGPLKMIDFGLSQYEPDADVGVAENIMELSWVIHWLALMQDAPFRVSGGVPPIRLGMMTGVLVDTSSFSTSSEEDEDEDAIFDSMATRRFKDMPLSEAFKLLICRCLAVDAALRPSLAGVLAVCETAVAGIADKGAVVERFKPMLLDAITR